jgi:NTP pyrophosphatase (non-canonical NTP hydrolase)
MKDTIQKIFDASKYDPKTIEQKALKLAEECGEVAQAVLSYCKAPGCEKKGKTKVDVIEETWDVIITAVSLLYQIENGKVDEENSIKTRDEKIKKWIEKFN